jgi:hypothetical protein
MFESRVFDYGGTELLRPTLWWFGLSFARTYNSLLWCFDRMKEYVNHNKQSFYMNRFGTSSAHSITL